MFAIALYFRLASGSYYFELSETTFYVKNYAVPFLQKEYLLREITKVFFENTGKSFSNACVRVEIKNRKSISYEAASLKIKHWQLLIKELKKRNIETEVNVYDLTLTYFDYDNKKD